MVELLEYIFWCLKKAEWGKHFLICGSCICCLSDHTQQNHNNYKGDSCNSCEINVW